MGEKEDASPGLLWQGSGEPFFKKLMFIYLFISVSTGSSSRFSLAVTSRGYSSLQCTGFSLQQLLIF